MLANRTGHVRPDIVFFMLDQLAAKWLDAGRAGAANVPNFERLAGLGTNFTRCITSNPLCCPARATLATGLSTRGHGVLQNGYYLDPSIRTFMQDLQGAGYWTGALGKVHFQPHYSSLHPDYRPYGFNVQHITEDGRGGEWLNWIRSEHPAYISPSIKLFGRGKYPNSLNMVRLKKIWLQKWLQCRPKAGCMNCHFRRSCRRPIG